MYERFTDLARSVVRLASEEARRLQCERMGTEHLLLALLQQESGAAAQVLTNLKVDRRKLQAEIERFAREDADGRPGGKSTSSPTLSDVIECAMEEARTLSHTYVGTEHMLLGLFCDREGLVANSFRATGLTEENVRGEVRTLIGKGFDPSDENGP